MTKEQKVVILCYKNNHELNKNTFFGIRISVSWITKKNARHIIERVVMRGMLSDWFEIKKYYGINRIKDEVVRSRYLDKTTLSFCSSYFNLAKEQFRCYNTEPSIRKLWNY